MSNIKNCGRRAKLGQAAGAWYKGALQVGLLAGLLLTSQKAHAQQSEDNGGPIGAVTVNLLGLALFGPDLNLEFGGQVSGLLRVRPFGLGYLSHSMFAAEDNQELSLGSLSVGLGGRYYLSGAGFQGVYLGLAAEYLRVTIEETQALGTLETLTTFLIPSLEGGWRTPLGPVLVGLGAQVGYAFALSEDCEFSAGICTVEPRENTVYGQAVADVGIRF
jgi:hypothetical protein